MSLSKDIKISITPNEMYRIHELILKYKEELVSFSPVINFRALFLFKVTVFPLIIALLGYSFLALEVGLARWGRRAIMLGLKLLNSLATS